ncbi:membrane protein insertion efficiency factor YidD [Leucobacter sp. 7(1)]|uniref:membrane protein insertion efficiency factor YidD n=1 Tax=Leucobacter sp. 7(1) TaxID=1255613 RepID=UPI000B36293B|nr:membrane protein insertion efficiency factor YidD [Leucobacter sp. 7(1)]
MIRLLSELWFAPRNLAIAIMLGYRRLISPLYGQVCRYYPSCSRYSMEAYQHFGLTAGLALTVWRLLRCNPFTSGGIDDVPTRKHENFVINSRGFVRPIERKA